MIGQVERQFLFLLTLAVVGISSKQGEKESGGQTAGTEDSLNSVSQKGTGKEEEMCKRVDPASQLGFHGGLGFGWDLVREEEREGKCPGTREKVDTHLTLDFLYKYKIQVEEYKDMATGDQRTVVTQMLNHKVLN